MNYRIIKKLPPIEAIIQAFPLSLVAQQRIAQDRQEVKDIFAGRDPRLLIIVGPCSAWPQTAVLEYAAKLRAVHERVKAVLKIVMRVYIQKPRTTKGWAGPVNQPDPMGSPDIEAGLRYTREMMVKIVEMGLPIADEALFTHHAKGFLELLTWVAIGARSTENQEHRVFASALDIAVGLKNPTHGSLAIGVNSVVAAQHPHVTILNGDEVQTQGNPYAHLVLRGANHLPNYSIAHLEKVKQEMEKHQIKNASVIIDASHDNCIINGKKEPSLQPDIILKMVTHLATRPDLKKIVKGFMLESFLKEGHQKLNLSCPERIDLSGLSITDPCLGWEQTEEFLLALAASKE